jgi:hypothetical protein
LIASEALAQVEKMLDDLQFVHTEVDVALRQLNRAHQYVALRYRLLRETVPVAMVANLPLYRLESVLPRAVDIVSAMTSEGKVLWPEPLEHIRQGDSQWLATADDAGPIWIYRVGLSWFGIYPVPTLDDTLQLTGLMVPVDLTTGGDALVVPDAYLPQVIMVTAGFLMIASERAHQQGASLVMKGLGVNKVANEPNTSAA